MRTVINGLLTLAEHDRSSEKNSRTTTRREGNALSFGPARSRQTSAGYRIAPGINYFRAEIYIVGSREWCSRIGSNEGERGELSFPRLLYDKTPRVASFSSSQRRGGASLISRTRIRVFQFGGWITACAKSGRIAIPSPGSRQYVVPGRTRRLGFSFRHDAT